MLGHALPELEGQLGGVLVRHDAVHVLDGGLDLRAVHERARVELLKGLGPRHLVGGGFDAEAQRSLSLGVVAFPDRRVVEYRGV